MTVNLATKLDLIPKNMYRSVLSKHLPQECFKPHTKQLLHYFFCIALYLGGLFLVLNISNLIIKLLISVSMGIILASLTFFLHDLFHGSILKSKQLSYVVGLSIGIFSLFAPLFWKRVHNLHHARTGDTDDPDRSYLFSERPKNLIEKMSYKIRLSNEAFHPFISLLLMSTGFFWYFLNTMLNGLMPRESTKDKKYKRIHMLFRKKSEKLFVLFELFLIFGFQLFLFFVLSKGNFMTYLLASILPILITHFITMSYIHTNHFLSPLTGEVDDPLINSLSLKNSWLVDKIFSNFSHHVEHHLFPSMSSAYYPKVRKLLQKFYPKRFQLIPYIDAIKMLLNTPRIYKDYIYLVSSDDTKKMLCLMPSK